MYKTMIHGIPHRLWKYVGVHIFTVNKKHYLCLVYYNSKFLFIKQVEGFRVDNLIKYARLSFQNIGLTVK